MMKYRLSFDVMEAFLSGIQNKYEEVYNAIDKLMEEALRSANYINYLQDFRIMCELLLKAWKNILIGRRFL